MLPLTHCSKIMQSSSLVPFDFILFSSHFWNIPCSVIHSREKTNPRRHLLFLFNVISAVSDLFTLRKGKKVLQCGRVSLEKASTHRSQGHAVYPDFNIAQISASSLSLLSFSHLFFLTMALTQAAFLIVELEILPHLGKISTMSAESRRERLRPTTKHLS